jgi:hypothetical protein
LAKDVNTARLSEEEARYLLFAKLTPNTTKDRVNGE